MVVSLRELQRIPTSGARAVEPFHVDGIELVAIPQLARDVPGQAAGMNVGDSDTDLLLLRRVGGRYEPYSALPAPGGEDAEFFTIGDRAFLAVASIRSGSGPYVLATPSRIFEWTGGRFVPFQSIETYAAKQWRHWRIGDRHFLALAQGLRLPAADAPDRDSVIYEWDGAAFAEFQPIPSQAAYNWHASSCTARRSSPMPTTSGRASSTAGTGSATAPTRCCWTGPDGASPPSRTARSCSSAACSTRHG